ncbi:hypothetical protein ACU686_00190 [Yinghuangia aomiensis]
MRSPERAKRDLPRRARRGRVSAQGDYDQVPTSLLPRRPAGADTLVRGIGRERAGQRAGGSGSTARPPPRRSRRAWGGSSTPPSPRRTSNPLSPATVHKATEELIRATDRHPLRVPAQQLVGPENCRGVGSRTHSRRWRHWSASAAEGRIAAASIADFAEAAAVVAAAHRHDWRRRTS